MSGEISGDTRGNVRGGASDDIGADMNGNSARPADRGVNPGPGADAVDDDIPARRVLLVLCGVGLVVALVVAAARAVVAWIGVPPGGANAPMDLRIPGPVLQSAPQRENAALVDAQRRAMGDPIAAADVTQRPGARLPLDARFADTAGRPVALSALFDGRPVIMVFGYYRCPDLCATLMESVLFSAGLMSLAPGAYRIVEVGIDPAESSADATARARAYRATYPGHSIELLTGSGEASRRVAAAAGVRYAYDPATRRYSHPLAAIVASADGRVSRYFAGIGAEPRELQLAVEEAAGGSIGPVTDRIFLRCAHFDPSTGRYTIAAMTAVRGAAGAIGLALAGWCAWLALRRSRATGSARVLRSGRSPKSIRDVHPDAAADGPTEVKP